MPRKVVIVGFPGVQALDVVGPHDVFSTASLLTNGGYDVVLGSVGGRPVTTPTGLGFATRPPPHPHDPAREGRSPGTTPTGLGFATRPLPDPHDPAENIDTVVVPGGGGVDAARSEPDLLAWIKAVAGTARRVITVCTGAFIAAEAGLLDGCRVTTHWAWAERLADDFPAVDVGPHPIFIPRSGAGWTPAGGTAG